MDFNTLRYENYASFERPEKMTEENVVLKSLGKKIAMLRKEKGMNQEEFAEISGKMINTISNIERGLSDPKLTTLLSLAEALEVSVNTLFDDNSNIDRRYSPDKLQKILALMQNQDQRVISVIEKQIEALLELV